jgi:hypothetical protein
MKKIKYIFLAIGSLLFISSCSDALDIVQEGEIYREDAFKTVTDLRKYLNGDIYTRVNNTEEIAFTSIFTDEVGIGPSNGGQDKELHRFQLNANSDEPATLWSNHYNVINRVNRLLEFADLVVTTTPADLAAKNAVLAEARALRAYSYIQLVSFFSVDPANPNALGVILSTKPDRYDLVVDRPRVSNQLIYDLIESDFLFAQANLAASATIYINVTQKFIAAARARMYLYRKDYVKAKQFALVATGTLSTPQAYLDMWGDAAGAQGECIFAASRPTGGTWSNIASTWYFNQTTATGGAFLDMGRNLFNLYNRSNDARGFAWIDATAQINPNYATDINYVSNDVLPINKYPGKGPLAPSAAQLRNDLKIFRNSEMVLILAECEVASGNLTAAATLVRSIRTARTYALPLPALPVYANAQAAWGDILLERRKELAYEGHRYLDIKRLAALAGNQGITRDNTDDDILDQPLTLSLSDYRFTLPIPQLEVAGNVNIQQNPGY